MRIPPRSLVVLVGPSGSGKSHWAQQVFRSDQIVSSDALRAVVGAGEDDMRAGTDAFAVLDDIVERRLKRGLLTVIDSLGLEPERRDTWVAMARQAGMAAHAVVFDTPDDVCRARNRGRSRPVPPKVLASQLARRKDLDLSAFDGAHTPGSVELVAHDLAAHTGQTLAFGLHISRFPATAGELREMAVVAEAIGFTSIWVMDHVLQIPQVGRAWEPMLESWTTLAWLAAHTTTARLGVLVTPVTFRNPAHLAKIVATADVLSGGRVTCGLGLGWWEQEHALYGWAFPDRDTRYALLEDTLQLLPLMWGPGSPPFKGQIISVSEATCYPRPVQEHVPILVGGSGPKRTLKLAARYADACNLFGDPAAVHERVAALQAHCDAAGRELIHVSHLSTVVAERTQRELDATLDRLSHAPNDLVLDYYGAAIIDTQIERYAALADAGVQTAIVAMPDAGNPGALEAFAEVIGRFR